MLQRRKNGTLAAKNRRGFLRQVYAIVDLDARILKLRKLPNEKDRRTRQQAVVSESRA